MQHQLGKMSDITAPDIVQIQIRHDSKVIWVNVNGECVLRCCKIGTLEVSDDRSHKADDNS